MTEAKIRELSDAAFKDHQITEMSRNGVFRSWRCGRSNSGIYALALIYLTQQTSGI